MQLSERTWFRQSFPAVRTFLRPPPLPVGFCVLFAGPRRLLIQIVLGRPTAKFKYVYANKKSDWNEMRRSK